MALTYSIDELAAAMAEGRPPRTREVMAALGIEERPDDDVFLEARPAPAREPIDVAVEVAVTGLDTFRKALEALSDAFSAASQPIVDLAVEVAKLDADTTGAR
jgi:hypothetical protein